ncbi:hypothetical protein [Anatilimnocola floriformis]|uniref:hypothetical protein n=1 Tax=Anatilimnocola floriformis TaxID=2948575 RepID=UPI0036F3F469
MAPTQELIDDIYRERVERARSATFDEKLLGGLELFDAACEWSRMGLRARFPDDSDEQIENRLSEQLARLESLEPQAWTIIPSSEASWML